MSTSLSVHGWNCDFGNGPLLAAPIDCELVPGKMYSIRGPFGCGKSTFLKALVGVLSPSCQKGSLRLHHRNRTTLVTSPLSNPVIASRIAYLPQDPDAGLVFTKVADELVYAREGVESAAPLKLDEIDNLLRGFPISHLVGRVNHSLSKGEQQAVAIAAALLKEPQVLVLDEPFSSLDAEMQCETARLLRSSLSVVPDLTIVYSTHLDDPENIGPVEDLSLEWSQQTKQKVAWQPTVSISERRSVKSVVCITSKVLIRDSQPLFKIPHFEVKAGEIVGLYGSNGSGKTSFAYALSGVGRESDSSLELAGNGALLFAESGSVDLTERCPEYVCHAFQSPEHRHLGRTVREDLNAGIHTPNGTGLFVHDKVTEEFGRFCALGYSHSPDDRVGQLSYGQQKVLQLSVHGTFGHLFVVDDPPRSSDSAEEALFADWLRCIAKTGSGVLILLHQADRWRHVVTNLFRIVKQPTPVLEHDG